LKFEIISTTLNEILNYQRSAFDKTGLGYSEKKEGVNEEASTSSKQSSTERTKSYVDIIKTYIKVEYNREIEQYAPRNTLPSKWNHKIRYQNYLFGYCYYCNDFGHKVIYFRTRVRDGYMGNNNRYTHEFSRRNYNSFSPFFNYNIICYKCNNYELITKL
jgi:hypothetical protein